ncbi:MAG TPA: GrpB family protein, partial [Dehalococcoidia bacterium]|nr:GrpB family protein [Dehalococcoidia bacterium]
VEHVGSTSVPGLGAKPTIDIVVGVRGLEQAFAAAVRPLQSLGYEHIPMPSSWDRRFFQRGPWRMGTHHVHLTEHEGAAWHDYLTFRDHLRAHPEVAQQYLLHKQRLAARPEIDRATYSAAKRPFIDGVIKGILGSGARP